MPRALKFFGFLVINVVVALIGTAIVDSTIGKVFPAHSLVTVLWKEWILSMVCAVFIGFGISFFLAIGSGAVWSQFCGTGCANGIRSVECRNFFVFTIPFIRSVSYSLGAYVSSLVQAAHSPAKAMVPPSTGA